MISFMASGSLASISETMGVSIVPRHTALMRIPREAYSRAALFVSSITPCFVAWYAARAGRPIRPPMDEQLTIAPLPYGQRSDPPYAGRRYRDDGVRRGQDFWPGV